MRAILGVLVLTFGFGSAASGDVVPANGNYYVSFTDLEERTAKPLASDSPVKVQRVYNSVSQFLGMFGYGWGYEFDSYLVPSADGSITIRESGSGAFTRFVPATFHESELRIFVGRLVDARFKRNPDIDIEAYRERLHGDASFREEEARVLDLRREVLVGTVLWSEERGSKKFVKRLADGYVRDDGNGEQHFFTVRTTAFDNGVVAARMRQVRDVYRIARIVKAGPPERTVDLQYEAGARPRLKKVTFSDGRFLAYQYGDHGFVARIDNGAGKFATYKYCPTREYREDQYCGDGDLIEVRDEDGSEFRYAYDAQHNMIEIRAGEKIDEAVTYWNTGRVKTVKVDGAIADYVYWSDPAAPDLHYRTNILHIGPTGGRRVEAYEWWAKRRDDGTSYLYRQLHRAGGRTIETLYNECCGQPLRITVNGMQTTEYEYDSDTRLLRERRSGSQVEQWEYASVRRGAVKRYRQLKPGKTEPEIEVSFEHDQRGRLVYATSPQMRSLRITYDDLGRVASLRSDNEALVLEYDGQSRPVRVVVEGKGSLVILYDAAGKISDTRTEGEVSAALTISTVFGDLNSFVQYAKTPD